MKLIEQFKAARRVSVPLIAVEGPDPATTIRTLGGVLNGKSAVFCWDCMNGLRALNEAGEQAMVNVVTDGTNPAEIVNPVELLRTAQALPEKAALFMLNAHLYLHNSPQVVQGIWNLRDQFKANHRTLIMTAPSMQLSPELAQDVLVLDEPYPTPEQLAEIVNDQFESAQMKKIEGEKLGKAVDAVAGLAAFPSEQEVAMCLTKDGLDMDSLWERKRKKIEQTKGLSVWRGGETFKDVVGIGNVTTFLELLACKRAFRAVVFMDEIEKMVGGGEMSHETTQAQMEAFLTWTQNTRALGLILTGIAGSGKSLTAKATGGTAGVPVVMMSLSGLRGSLVGETEQNTRTAFKTVDAIAQGRVLMIATCNRMPALTPEVRSRFRLGTFFFDYPDEQETVALWKLYRGKFNVDAKYKTPAVKNWVGREIESCCEISGLLGISLEEASKYIVPVAQSAADDVERIKSYASGRFISASRPGVYVYNKAAVPTGRKIEL